MPAKDLLPTLWRPRKRGADLRRVDSHLFQPNTSPSSPGPASREYHQHRHATADFTEPDDEEDEDEEDRDEEDDGHNDDENSDHHGGEDRSFLFPRVWRRRSDDNGQAIPTGLLPLFSASHLGKLCESTRFQMEI